MIRCIIILILICLLLIALLLRKKEKIVFDKLKYNVGDKVYIIHNNKIVKMNISTIMVIITDNGVTKEYGLGNNCACKTENELYKDIEELTKELEKKYFKVIERK